MTRALSAAERQQLLDATRFSRRDHLLFHVALGGPLMAREVVAIDMGDLIAEDGKVIREAVRLKRRGAGRVAKMFYLSLAGRQVAAELITEQRKSCPHSSAGSVLGTYSEADGVQRCHACRRPVDWRTWPLFEARAWTARRLSPGHARRRFAKWRTRLGWGDGLTFDCLRATYEARAAEAVREGLAGHG